MKGKEEKKSILRRRRISRGMTLLSTLSLVLALVFAASPVAADDWGNGDEDWQCSDYVDQHGIIHICVVALPIGPWILHPGVDSNPPPYAIPAPSNPFNPFPPDGSNPYPGSGGGTESPLPGSSPWLPVPFNDQTKAEAAYDSLWRVKYLLKTNKNCNDYVAAPIIRNFGMEFMDPNDVVDNRDAWKTLDNLRVVGGFNPFGGNVGDCDPKTALAWASAYAFRDDNPWIKLCDGFYEFSNESRDLILLHELYHLYGGEHPWRSGKIGRPDLDAVPYNVDLAAACGLRCPDGYHCTSY